MMKVNIEEAAQEFVQAMGDRAYSLEVKFDLKDKMLQWCLFGKTDTNGIKLGNGPTFDDALHDLKHGLGMQKHLPARFVDTV